MKCRKPICSNGFSVPENMDLGKRKSLLGTFLGENARKKVAKMRKLEFKGRCEKRVLSKCKEVCRTYDPIQSAYADRLQVDDSVREFQCNVQLDDGVHMTDFVCVKTDGELMVRECVQRKYLLKPMTIRLMDISWAYWKRHGVEDWGLVVDADEEG